MPPIFFPTARARPSPPKRKNPKPSAAAPAAALPHSRSKTFRAIWFVTTSTPAAFPTATESPQRTTPIAGTTTALPLLVPRLHCLRCGRWLKSKLLQQCPSAAFRYEFNEFPRSGFFPRRFEHHNRLLDPRIALVRNFPVLAFL